MTDEDTHRPARPAPAPAPVAQVAGATAHRGAPDLHAHLERLRDELADRAGLDLLSVALAAMRAVQADGRAAVLLEALESDAREALEQARTTERRLVGAAVALLDDADEHADDARRLGWIESEARRHLDALRRTPGALAGEIRFSRLGDAFRPPLAAAVTGIVQHDLEQRLVAFGPSAPAGRLEGHVECAAALRVEALTAERRLERGDASPGAAAGRLRIVSAAHGGPLARRHRPPLAGPASEAERALSEALMGRGSTKTGDSALASALMALRADATTMLEAIMSRLSRPVGGTAQVAVQEEAGSTSDDGPDGSGSAPRERAADRKASPRAA